MIIMLKKFPNDWAPSVALTDGEEDDDEEIKLKLKNSASSDVKTIRVDIASYKPEVNTSTNTNSSPKKDQNVKDDHNDDNTELEVELNLRAIMSKSNSEILKEFCDGLNFASKSSVDSNDIDQNDDVGSHEPNAGQSTRDVNLMPTRDVNLISMMAMTMTSPHLF